MNGWQFRNIIKKAKEHEYDQVTLCLTDCEEIIIKPGTELLLDMDCNMVSVCEDYEDLSGEWDVAHFINLDHIVNVRVEKKKNEEDDDDVVVEVPVDYREELKEEYEKLVEKKDKPYRSGVITTVSYPWSRKVLRPPEVWYSRGDNCRL